METRVDLICEFYGNCEGKCRMTGIEEWDKITINCPVYQFPRNPRWVILSDEMRRAME